MFRSGWGAAALAGALGLAACGTGSVDIVLDQPASAALAPAGAATVTLVTEQPGQPTRAQTSPIADDGSFDLGKLPVTSGLELSVILRSANQRVVGYGRAAGPIDVLARDPVEVDVQMRRPFAYVTGPAPGLAALDTTLDSSQKSYQQTIQLSGAADLVASAGPDVWAIASGGAARRIAGATHQPDGSAITLPAGLRDAAASIDGRWLVAGYGGGLAIADVKSGNVAMLAVAGGVDRVAVGADGNGGLRAIGLSGRRAAGACTSSKLALVALGDTLGQLDLEDAHAPLADFSASESSADLVGVDPCGNQLLRLGVGGDASGIKLADVPSPTAAAMFGDRAWALGTVPGVDDGTGVITTPAHLVLIEAAVDGSSKTRADLPGVHQIAHGYDVDGNDLVLSRDMYAQTVTPVDLVVAPPGDQIAILYSASFHAPPLTQGLTTVIPMMTATTSEYELLNATGGALVQRVLDQCDLTYDTTSAVPLWKCEPYSGADWPPQAQGTFTPKGLAVLYGGR